MQNIHALAELAKAATYVGCVTSSGVLVIQAHIFFYSLNCLRVPPGGVNVDWRGGARVRAACLEPETGETGETVGAWRAESATV